MTLKTAIRIILASIIVAHLWFAASYSLVAVVIDNWLWIGNAETPHFVLTILVTVMGSVLTMGGVIDRWNAVKPDTANN